MSLRLEMVMVVIVVRFLGLVLMEAAADRLTYWVSYPPTPAWGTM